MISLINHHSSEGDQWGRDEIYPELSYFTHLNSSAHFTKLGMISLKQIYDSRARENKGSVVMKFTQTN